MHRPDVKSHRCPPPYRPQSCADSDGDGVPDVNDTDSDNDGYSDLIEWTAGHDGRHLDACIPNAYAAACTSRGSVIETIALRTLKLVVN